METPKGSGSASRPDRSATPRLSERKRRLFGSPVTRIVKINDDEDEDVDILGVSPLKPHVTPNKPSGGPFTEHATPGRRRVLRSSPNSSPETNKENKTGRSKRAVVAATATEEQLPHLFTTTMRLNSNSSSSQASSPRTPKQGRRQRPHSPKSSPASEAGSPAVRQERAKPKPRPEVSESSTRRSPRNEKLKTMEPSQGARSEQTRISPRNHRKNTKTVNNTKAASPGCVTTELGQKSSTNSQKSPVSILKPTRKSNEGGLKSRRASVTIMNHEKDPKSPLRIGGNPTNPKTPKSNIEMMLASEDEVEEVDCRAAPRQPQKRLHPATPSAKAGSSTESDSGSPQSKLRRMNLESSIPTMAFYSHSESGATRAKGTQGKAARTPQTSKAKTSPKRRVARTGINNGVRHKIRKRPGLSQHLPQTNLNHILSSLRNERLKNLITTKREERAKVEEVHEILRTARDPIKMAKPLSVLDSEDANNNNNNNVSVGAMWRDTDKDFSDLSEDEEKVDILDPAMELEPIIPLIRHETTTHTSPPAETVDLSKRKFFKSGRRSSTCMEVRITDNIKASVSQGKIALVQTPRRKPRSVRVKSATIFSAEQATVDAILKSLNDSVFGEIVESEPKEAITPMETESESLPETIETEARIDLDPFAVFRQRLPYQTEDPELIEQQQILLEFLISNNICTEENFEIFIANPDSHKEEANRIVDDLYMVVNSEEASAQVAQMEAVPQPVVVEAPPPPDPVPEEAQPKLFPIFTQRLQPVVQKSSRRRPSTSMRLLSEAAGGSNQYQIDAGQKAFGARQCQQCGLVYTVHEPEEEQLHREYHNSIHVLRFKGWIDEDIVAVYPEWGNDGRIVRLNERAPAARLERLKDLIGVVDKELGYSSYIVPKIFVAFMAVRKQQIVGFCLVQPLSQAHRFIQVDGTDYFSEETYQASCGVSRIWVSPLHRRGGIASKLIRAVQCHTIIGQEISMELIAFSTPTDDGRALARRLTGLDNFLTYDQ
ncbi:hypothetical protein KR059_008528 [Drosophila kikkawai]|nr:hypothetical protein KR059_008528 [Drosophila kikkawai]